MTLQIIGFIIFYLVAIHLIAYGDDVTKEFRDALSTSLAEARSAK